MGKYLINHQAEQGEAHGNQAAQAERLFPPGLVAGGVVIGQQRQQAVGHTDGKIQGQLIQLLDNPQGGHRLCGILGHKVGLGRRGHHGQCILQGRWEPNGQNRIEVAGTVAQVGGIQT